MSAWLDTQFLTLAARAPWLTPADRSVLDACSVSGGSGGLINRGPGFSLSCARTDTRYYAYGGLAAARIAQLKRVLSGVGWANYAPVLAVTRSRLPQVQASPARTSQWPGARQALEYSWAGRASQLSPRSDLGAVGPRIAPQRNYYVQALPPSLSAILSRLTVGRPHVLIVSITVTYAQKGPLSAA